MKKSRHFLIPMIVSIILLPCFLAYFLKSEFEKEKEAMILESKEESFDNFFAVLDTLEFYKEDKTHPLISFKKDSSRGRYNYEFKLESLSKSHSIDDVLPPDSDVRFEIFEFLEPDSVVAEKKIDQFFLRQRKPNSFPAILGKEPHIHKPIFTTKKKGAKPIWGGDSSRQVSLGLGHKKAIVIKDDQGIKTSDVLQRLLPQIFFSSFLLLSVFLAYWYIARSLKQERQLALIRNDFMSNMSHELKTPVSTIGVALEALSTFDAADNPELRKEYIDISKHEVERLGLLVDKALNISLYEQGRFVFDRQPIDIKLEIEKVLKTLRVQLDNQNVDLEYRCKGSDFVIDVDRTHMVNVVYNLIENGIKYSEGQAEVSIELQEKGGYVEFSIADKGRGIAPEFQTRVFEKFFRVPQGDTHNVKGHGLGLSYVKEVVESMGGSIHLKSGVDAGSTFIIKIPKAND